MQRVLAFNTMPQNIITIYPNDMTYSAMLLRRKIGGEIMELEKTMPTLIVGHVGFGLLEALGMTGTYLTLLRDPVARCISEYYFAKENTFHHLHQTINREGMSLLEYFRRYPKWHTNLQARMIGGKGGAMLAHDMPPTRMVALASNNLKRIGLLGLQELFGDFLVVLSAALPHFFVWNEKVNEGGRGAHRNPTDDERAELEELNWADVQLYEIAKEICAERFSKIANVAGIRSLVDRRTELMSQARAVCLSAETPTDG